MKFRRFCSLFLAVLMLLAGSAVAETAEYYDTNIYGGLVALPDANDPITYTIFVRDSGMTADPNNPVLKKITELTGITFKFEYLVGDLDQRLGVMIAGGEYPDIMFSGDTPKLVDAGAFIPLENYIPQYKNLNALYGGCMENLKLDDGHIYNLEMYSVMRNNAVTEPGPTFECGIGFYIQKDVLAENGYKVPTTLDEYFTMIENYKAKYPTIDGVETVGFEILCDGWRNWALLNPVQNLLGDGNDGNMYINHATHEPSFFQATDDAYAFYKKLNEEYHKGVIRAETLTQSYDQYISKLTTGAVLGFYDQNWNFGSAEDLLEADGKYNRTYISVPITNPGVTAAYIDGTDPRGAVPTGLNGLGITVNCKNPERFLTFVDWLLQREVQDYLQWGEEGVDYTLTADGEKVLTAERRAINLDTAKKRDLTGSPLTTYMPMWMGVYKADGEACGPDSSAAEYLAKQTKFDIEFLTGLGVQYPAGIHPDPVVKPDYYPVWAMALEDGSAAAIANNKIVDVTTKYYARLVLAEDDAAYDKIWSDFVKEFNAINLDALKTEVERQIEVKLSK